MAGHENNSHLHVICTGDGSATIKNTMLNATYHSTHGAVQESKHIFIEHGLNYAIAKFGKQLNILEIGFGTGLNAFLTLIESEKRTLNIHYTGIEKFPLHESVYKRLNYAASSWEHTLFELMHAYSWEKRKHITGNFSLLKLSGDVRELELDRTYHLIYFDAFAPATSPELWTASIFEKTYESMVSGAALVTFCAKGEVKRILKKTGFKVETLAGPPGKREMVRAVKIY